MRNMDDLVDSLMEQMLKRTKIEGPFIGMHAKV